MAHLRSQPLLAPILTLCQIYLRLVKNCSLKCVHKVIVYGQTDHDSNSLQPKIWLRAKNNDKTVRGQCATSCIALRLLLDALFFKYGNLNDMVQKEGEVNFGNMSICSYKTHPFLY